MVRYDLRAQRELEPWGSPDQVYHGVAARAGLVYVLGGQSGFLEVYEEGAERRAPRERVALAAVPRSLVLEPGGAWAAIGTYTGEIRRLDLKTKTFLPPFMAPDVRTAHQGVVARNELAHHSSVRAMVFARDGALLSSSMGDQREINELRIWDPESRQERRPVFKPNLRLSESLAVSADGIRARDRLVVSELRGRGIPTLFLPSGGYTPESWQLIADSLVELAVRPGEVTLEA